MKTAPDSVVPALPVHIGFSKTWPAWLLLVLALGASLVGWRMASTQVDERIQAVLADESNHITNRLSQSVNQSHEVLRSFQGLYATQPQVVRDVFELFAGVPVSMYEGVTSIGFAPRISSGSLESFRMYARNEGYAAFTISPAGPRPEYRPVEFIVPARHLSLVGQDFAARQDLAPTLTQAFDGGQVTLSPVVPLLSSKERGLFFFAPVTQKSGSQWTSTSSDKEPVGVVFLEIALSPFLKGNLGSVIDPSRIEVSLYDGSPESGTLIEKGPESSDIIGTLDRSIDVGGRTWTLRFRGREALSEGINRGFPLLVGLGGIGISLLLFGFTYSLLTSRSRAQALAERITRSQRRIVDSSQDIIGILDTNGVWKSINPAVQTVFGFSPQEIIGRPHLDQVLPSDRQRLESALAEAPDEVPISIEARYRLPDGSVRWVSWSVTTSRTDGLIYVIGRDVSERRETEARIRLQNRRLDLAGLMADHENRLKESTVRSQSLELRTQLTGIMGFLDLVLADAGLSREEELDFIRTAHASATTLLDSFQPLTQVSFAKAADLMAEPMQTLPLTTLFTSLEDNLRDHQLQLRVEGVSAEASVSALPGRTAEALTTLLLPLVSDATQEIRLTCERGHEAADQLRVRFLLPATPTAINALSAFLAQPDPSRAIDDDATFALGVARTILEFSDATVRVHAHDDEAEMVVEFPML